MKTRLPASLLPSLPTNARLLLIRLRSIGDIVLLTPALRLLKDWRPDLRLSVLLESRFAELLQHHPDVDEVLLYPRVGGLNGFFSSVHFVRELRRRRFQLCLNLHGGPTSAWLAAASGAQAKVSFAKCRARYLYDFLIPDAPTILGKSVYHTAEHQTSAFFYLGLPSQAVPAGHLVVTSKSQAWWQEKRNEMGTPEGKDYALLHPTARFDTKVWPAERFAQLGAHLERELSLIPFYLCGPGEETALDKIEQVSSRRIRRLTNLPLGRLSAVLAGGRLFVGNDSGPAHMAAAFGVPSVVIFGSSSSQFWGPWPPIGPHRIVQNPFDCNPCRGYRCERFTQPECILSVTFEQVRAAVEAVLHAAAVKPTEGATS